MRAYTVHAPPDDAKYESGPERFAFVKDGVAWPALLVPVLWILWHRMWLTLIGYVIFVLAVAWTERLVNEDVATIVALLGAVLFALEANNLRRLALARRGWREIGGSFGQDLHEAELRFFDAWSRAAASATPADRRDTIARAAYPSASRRQRSDEPILGLFPEPER